MTRVDKLAWATLALVLLLPLFSMAVIPYYDTSEPRYAEIARLMAQSGDWITPWFRPEVPFWGKPPLSFWAQSLSMKMFGFIEFAGRFPSWICLLLNNAILLIGLRSLYGWRIALWAATIYSSCTLVYLSSGAVLTDPFLALGTNLSLASFAVVMQGRRLPLTWEEGRQQARTEAQSKRWLGGWSYLFFIGLAIGLLAKGPLAMVLISAPILVWLVCKRENWSLLVSLPWGKGLLLVAALSLPWFILAEIKTPGFLDYFIIGEHFRRFLDPGWAGDMYGSAHKRAYGTIWYYWIQASFPWGIVILGLAVGAIRSSRLRLTMRSVGDSPLFGYWLASALAAPIFFTFSANILWTYLLPALAGFSVLAALIVVQVTERFSFSQHKLLPIAGIVPTVLVVLSTVFWIKPDLRKTERSLVYFVTQLNEPSVPLLYLSSPPFSAQFYSAGRARGVSHAELLRAVDCGPPFYLAVPKGQQQDLASILKQSSRELFSNKRYVLVKVMADQTCGQPGQIAAM